LWAPKQLIGAAVIAALALNGFDGYYGHCGSLDMPPYVAGGLEVQK
jgi:hypothetical protein